MEEALISFPTKPRRYAVSTMSKIRTEGASSQTEGMTKPLLAILLLLLISAGGLNGMLAQ